MLEFLYGTHNGVGKTSGKQQAARQKWTHDITEYISHVKGGQKKEGFRVESRQ